MDGFPDLSQSGDYQTIIPIGTICRINGPKLRRNQYNRKRTQKTRLKETQGRRIRCLRKVHNLTRKDLSKLTAIPLSDIIRIEANRQKLTTLHTAAFAEIFKVDADWLLWGDFKLNRSSTEPPDAPFYQQAQNLLKHLQGDTERMQNVLDFIYFQLRAQMVKYPPVP